MSLTSHIGLQGGPAAGISGLGHLGMGDICNSTEDRESRISVLWLGEVVRVRVGDKAYAMTYQKAVIWRSGR